jgi:hypothetical protein
MADVRKTPPARRSFNWIQFYGFGLGAVLAALAIWQSTPLMTGRLSAAHASFESRCELCHTPYRGVQDASCRSCHPEIGGNSPSIIHRGVKGNCATCHHEHRSRAYPLRLGDIHTFNHELTGFSLRRHHRNLNCSACHRPGNFYYQVARQCADCHRNWNSTNFNHARVIGIPLIQHGGLTCADCHPGQHYEAPVTCSSCHDPGMRHVPGQTLWKGRGKAMSL